MTFIIKSPSLVENFTSNSKFYKAFQHNSRDFFRSSEIQGLIKAGLELKASSGHLPVYSASKGLHCTTCKTRPEANFYFKFHDFPDFSRICTNPVQNTWGRGKKILRFSIEIAVYLGNGTRQALAHGYYGNVNRKS